MNNRNCRKKKNEANKLFDLNKFDEWFALTYKPVNCGEQKVPKIISFKEHIRILKERDNEYNRLLNEYNELVDRFNRLQDAFYEATGERYIEDTTKEEE